MIRSHLSGACAPGFLSDASPWCVFFGARGGEIMKFTLLGAAVLAAALCATRSFASVIYTYTGADFDQCVIGQSTACTPSGSVTGTMEFVSPLSANLSGSAVTPDAFSFSDGTGTITDSNWDSVWGGFLVTTDASGNLTGWAINIFDTTDTFSIYVARPPIYVYSGSTTCPIGDLINGCTNATTLSATTDGTMSVTTVPLPAALPLLATGLGALGLSGLRRKQKKATATVQA